MIWIFLVAIWLVLLVVAVALCRAADVADRRTAMQEFCHELATYQPEPDFTLDSDQRTKRAPVLPMRMR